MVDLIDISNMATNEHIDDVVYEYNSYLAEQLKKIEEYKKQDEELLSSFMKENEKLRLFVDIMKDNVYGSDKYQDAAQQAEKIFEENWLSVFEYAKSSLESELNGPGHRLNLLFERIKKLRYHEQLRRDDLLKRGQRDTHFYRSDEQHKQYIDALEDLVKQARKESDNKLAQDYQRFVNKEKNKPNALAVPTELGLSINRNSTWNYIYNRIADDMTKVDTVYELLKKMDKEIRIFKKLQDELSAIKNTKTLARENSQKENLNQENNLSQKEEKTDVAQSMKRGVEHIRKILKRRTAEIEHATIEQTMQKNKQSDY